MKTKWPAYWIYYASIVYISAKTQCSAMLAGPLIFVKNPGKVRNWRVTKLRTVVFLLLIITLHLILVKTFISLQLIHGCRYMYCDINTCNTNELHLLVSMFFWVKEGIDRRTNLFEKKTAYGFELVCSYFWHKHYHMNNWLVSFEALNHTHSISR